MSLMGWYIRDTKDKRRRIMYQAFICNCILTNLCMPHQTYHILWKHACYVFTSHIYISFLHQFLYFHLPLNWPLEILYCNHNIKMFMKAIQFQFQIQKHKSICLNFANAYSSIFASRQSFCHWMDCFSFRA